MPEQDTQVENLRDAATDSIGATDVATAESVQTQGTEAQSFTAATLDDLPPEARPLVERRLKEMTADYTRKTQEIAEQRRMAAIGELVTKNPQILAMLQGNAATTQQRPEVNEDDEFISKLEPEAVRGVTALLRKWAREELEPRYQPIISTVEEIAQESVRSKWDGILKEYPEAEEFQAEVGAFLQANPQIKDLKKAVFAAAGDKILAKREAAARRADTASRQQAQLTRPGTPAQMTKPTEKPKHAKLADAFKAVMEQRRGQRS